MRKVYQEGKSCRKIAQMIDRAPSTVRDHCLDRCTHTLSSEPESIDEILEMVHEVADENGAVPFPTDWRRSEKCPYSVREVIDMVGEEWSDVLQAAGYPPVAESASIDFRQKVYQNQQLCEVFS